VETERTLTQLRDEIKLMKRELDAQRPDEAVDLEADEEELIEQEAAKLLQMEETEYDENMDESEDIADTADAKEQHKGAETPDGSQRKHTEEEVATTLPFRSPWTESSREKAMAPFRTLRARPSTASFKRSEEERLAKEEKMNSLSWRK
jgi:hypothetical protein